VYTSATEFALHSTDGTTVSFRIFNAVFPPFEYNVVALQFLIELGSFEILQTLRGKQNTF
jgi:hypothetical protein